MRTAKILAVGLALCCAVSCSPRDFLTRRLAADLISGADAFRAPQVFWLKTGIVSNKDFNSPESLVLQRRGWITGTAAPCPPSVEPSPCWDVVLSPIGVETFRPLIANSMLTTNVVSIRVARRQLIEITGISKAGNSADVDFTWHWLPINDVGTALYDSGVQYRSTVAFRSYDDGWRVVTDPIRVSQPLEDALRNSQTTQSTP